MKCLFPLLLLCSSYLAHGLENSPDRPGTATPQPYERPAIRSLPVSGPGQSPPLLQKLPPAEGNVPSPRVPQLEQPDRQQRRSADAEADLTR